MQKILLVLALVSIDVNATVSLRTLSELSGSVCTKKVNERECEEAVNTIISLAIYNGYAAGLCSKIPSSYNLISSNCIKIKSEMASLLKKVAFK